MIGTGATGEGVVGSAADETVGAVVADEGIGEAIACGVDVGGASEGEIFNVGGGGEGDRGLNQVGACAGGFGDNVGGMGDDIGVITGAAGESAGSGIAREGVVGGVAVGGACGPTGDGDVFGVVGESEIDRGLNQIGAF